MFGRTGRPLNDKEKSLNKSEIILARLPIVILKGSKVSVASLSLKQLEAIVTGKVTNWKDLGGENKPIFFVGRDPNEAALSVLKKEYKFFSNAIYNRVVKRDHYVNFFLESKEGEYGLGFGVKLNFKKSQILNISDFNPSIGVGLVYDNKNLNHPLVKSVKEYSESKEWKKFVSSKGYQP